MMNRNWKRIVSLLLVLALCAALLPATFASAADSKALTGDDFAAADAIFDGALAEARAKKATADDEALVDAVYAYVSEADGVQSETVALNDGAVNWYTDDGIFCVFSPRMYHILDEMQTPDETNTAPETQVIYNSNETKSTSSARDVYLVGPYYGIDSSFGDTYEAVATGLAEVTGGNVHVVSGYSANINTLANALQSGAIVLLDSHGGTDSNDSHHASRSYLCLNSTTGLTSSDFNNEHSAYFYGGAVGVDGTTMANHMTKNAPNSFVWDGACLSMSTNTICNPLRNKGVHTFYGYSDSVTFVGDEVFLDYFWTNMIEGQTVKQAAANMKSSAGAWDLSPQIFDYYGWDYDSDTVYNLSQAQTPDSDGNYTAMPMFASAQDAYPSALQTLQNVKSDWTMPRATVTISFSVPQGVAKIDDITVYAGSEISMPYPEGKPRATDASYEFIGWLDGTYTGYSYPGDDYYVYDAGERFTIFGSGTAYALYLRTAADGTEIYTTDVPDGPEDPNDPSVMFTDVPNGKWYNEGIRFAVEHGLMNGYTDGTFRPNAELTRGQMITVIYRMAGAPGVEPTSAYSDVPTGKYYTNAVAWGSANGVVTGYTDGTFRPDAPVTREQLATMLYRYSSSPAADQSVIASFPDGGSVHNYAKNAMAWAVSNGLITGSKVGSQIYLQPANNANRAQFATIMMRYMQKS